MIHKQSPSGNDDNVIELQSDITYQGKVRSQKRNWSLRKRKTERKEEERKQVEKVKEEKEKKKKKNKEEEKHQDK